MSTRRSSSRSMMRSLTPWRPPSGLRGSATSSQFLNAARWSSPQNFERALSAAQSVERLGEALRLPVRGAARQVLRDVEAERHRQLLLLDGGEVEVRAAARSGPPPSRRNSRSAASCPLPNTLPGANSVGTIAAANSWNTGCRPAVSAEQQVRHEHRHQPRQRACGNRPSSARCRDRASTADRSDSTSVAPSMSAEHGLDLLRRRGDDRLLGLRARRDQTIDSRMTPSRMPLSAPGAPDACRVARIGRASTDERGTVVNGSRGS